LEKKKFKNFLKYLENGAGRLFKSVKIFASTLKTVRVGKEEV